jgi:hypothetical protein
MVRVEDTKNGITTIFYQNPFWKRLIPSADLLFSEMSPVYAMFREALNSHSYFYKFLCYYKILEGLLGPLRSEALRRAKALNLRVELQKQIVPEIPDLTPELNGYVGKSINRLFDNLLRPRYRDAVAHFVTRGGVLHVGQPDYTDEYARIIVICERCARDVAVAHETILKSILRAEAVQP